MKTNFIKTVILFPIFFSGVAMAASRSEKIPYYGEAFYQELNSGAANKDLALRIKSVLKFYHTPSAGVLDQITPDCNGPRCYIHTAAGYDAARVFLFGKFYLLKDDKGYGVKDVYCDHPHMSEDFKSGSQPGPGKVPDSTVINAEHTWPQSRFSGKYPTQLQKSDVHHLFPTDSQMNAIRGNGWFGEVVQDSKTLKCKNVRFGQTATGGADVFEPPKEHRGNLSRALFYFSTRYDMPIEATLEAVLRKWHKEDPVDEEEMDRNEQIFKLQNNRNPFIDYPELVDKLSDF